MSEVDVDGVGGRPISVAIRAAAINNPPLKNPPLKNPPLKIHQRLLLKTLKILSRVEF